jgi:hypothetical protein
MTREECPRISETTLSGTPWVSITLAAEVAQREFVGRHRGPSEGRLARGGALKVNRLLRL